jgi:hypothetical protein
MLYFLTDPNATASTPNPFHDQLSLEIMEEIYSDVNGSDTKLLCKLLNNLRLSKSTPPDTLKVLHFLTQALIQKLPDKNVTKSLEKFVASLEELDKGIAEKVLPEDKLAELTEKVTKAFGEEMQATKEDETEPDKAEKKKPTKAVQQQKDYFNAIDNFEVKGMTKKPLRKSGDKKKVTIVEEADKEKEELAKRNKDLEDELKRLKEMLANQSKTPQ